MSESIVVVVYGLANLLLLMYVGFGGAKPVMDVLCCFPVALLIYWVLCVLAVFLPLLNASARIRNVARYAIFTPWAFLVLIVTPQLPQSPLEVLEICVGAALVWYSYVPGELLVGRLGGSDPKEIHIARYLESSELITGVAKRGLALIAVAMVVATIGVAVIWFVRR